MAQWGRPLFDGSVERLAGAADGEISFTLPRLGRNWTSTTTLSGERVPLRFALPVAGGGNPHAIYRIGVAVAAGGLQAQRSVELAGIRSATASLGQARRSSDLPPGTMGTCGHFHYSRRGPFVSWAPHERLLDLAAEAGLTWIRDGVSLVKDASGKDRIDPHDLGWLTLVKARKLKPIICLDMNAQQPPEKFAAVAATIAQELAGLASVFELGNEPQNFGSWLKTFGGTWNGKEKDGSTSPWVKAHLASSNAAAEAIRKVRPDATIIGLGACTPTNFRAIDLGLSKAIDGVVDHPYNGCMSAERVPFCLGLAERDGVRVGDEAGSFVGLIRSYQDKLASLERPRQVWITEFGWTTFLFNGGNESGLEAGFSEQAQAVYLVRRWITGLGLGVPASCQYALLDDYGSTPGNDGANFGLLRGDYSRKPGYYAAQHTSAIFNGQQPDPAARIEIVKAALHRGAQRGVVVKDWDGAAFSADNNVQAWAFSDPQRPDERTLAVWSAQPVSGEFSPRYAEIRVTGWKEMTAAPLAVDLLTGACLDVPHVRDGDALVLKLNLGDAPLAIRLFRN